MSVQTAILASLVILLGIAQYVLAAHALVDLRRRPRVRGDSRVLWALCILCLPIGGPLIYHWMGPTSFRSRPLASLPRVDQTPTNVTPISAARSARRSTAANNWPPTPTTRRRKPGQIDRTVS